VRGSGYASGSRPLPAGTALRKHCSLWCCEGVLLAPAGVGLTFVASGRTSARSFAFWARTVLNACLAIGFVLAIGILIYGVATGQGVTDE
jgi:hypothetical protein